jgi:aryl-alcohol dehydrogenase-like predicted oxidoreductase
MKIALGTVQFGLPYGISNKYGQVPEEETKKILTCSQECGISVLDTAIGYGESEQRLGNIGIENWDVITKLPEIPKDCINVDAWIKRQFANSLERLNVNQVSGLMLHQPMQLVDAIGNDIWQTIQELKENGLVKKVGFSVYSPNELDRICIDFQPDIVQVPLNILDQRFIEKGHICKLKNNGVEVHVRSAFLQGLLLMPIEDIPPWFNPIIHKLELFRAEANKRNISTLQLAIGFVESINEVDKVVVGVNTLDQLHEIIDAASVKIDSKGLKFMSVKDIDFINPTNWEV